MLVGKADIELTGIEAADLDGYLNNANAATCSPSSLQTGWYSGSTAGRCQSTTE